MIDRNVRSNVNITTFTTKKNVKFDVSNLSSPKPTRKLRSSLKLNKLEKSEPMHIDYHSFGLFRIIFLFMALFAIAGLLKSGSFSDITFKGLLEFCANAPSFDISWSMIDLTIYSDWYAFNFLKEFFNFFTSMFEFCVIIFGFLIETLEFIFYFARGIFALN